MAICSPTVLLLTWPVTSPSFSLAQTGPTAGAESKYACGLSSEVFAGMPSAPANDPKRLSKEWFSSMTSMTCVTGTSGTFAAPAAAPAAVTAAVTAAEGTTTDDTAAATARTGTPHAARSLERFTRPIVPRSAGDLAPLLPACRYCKHG